MTLATRWVITGLIGVAYGAALVTLASGAKDVLSISVAGAIFLTAAALVAINWVWTDPKRKDKDEHQ